ncbi:olfactory receptor 10A7-like [Bombina bombina]|uniref:olfactory receptor 10A7-like n=1 Tax=Bombina bombina TaxID=8345 RepID=UPI00235A4F27|nr:olfactory receptor 10A7-like [Bombina bombina]
MHRLGSSNQTTFILVAFTFEPRVQLAFFILFLIIYSISLLGNIAIIVAICLNQRLRTPMYSFLCSLAFLDIWFISSTVPKLLAILVSDDRIISLPGCIMQHYFYVSLGGTEFYLLAVMSVDRYAAICQPLRYHSIISSRTCLCLASTVILGSFTMTLVSYSNILFTILNIPSADGRKKAFSTCTSHFTAVSLAYGSAIVIYVRPVESSSPNLNKGVALLNSVLTPLLNPFICSLRNKQVQNVLKDTLCRKSEFS